MTLPPCAGPEFGPSMQKKFGKSGTVKPRYAVGLSLAHFSRRSLPSRPVMLRRAAISVHRGCARADHRDALAFDLKSSDQSAECRPWPRKSSSPLKPAREGSLSWPIALTRAVDWKISSPCLVFSVEIQRRLLSSQRDDFSSVLSLRCLRMPYSVCDLL